MEKDTYIQQAQEFLDPKTRTYVETALSLVVGAEERKSQIGVSEWFAGQVARTSIQDALCRYENGYDTENGQSAVLVSTLVEAISTDTKNDIRERREFSWWKDKALGVLMREAPSILDTMAKTTYKQMWDTWPQDWKPARRANV